MPEGVNDFARPCKQTVRGVMLFTSLEFLFSFLPLTLGGYFLLPFKAKNYWLLACSLLFYTWGEPSFVVVMIGSILFNYVMVCLMDRLKMKTRPHLARTAFILTVLGNLSLLFVYKYLNFITELIREICPTLQGVIPQTSILLPIGISFFTFQAMSYVIDVYRGKAEVQKNPAYLALYIALFPQLIAGPIVRYTTVCKQIQCRHTTFSMFSTGVIRFLYGFNKKMLLANLCAIVADDCFAMPELSVASAWLGAIAYTLQIYFDFSGYSEMAIGLGLLFGFNFPKNFDYPYISKTVTEFWRRWHISLGEWFRDYLYFPLGGSRVTSNWRLIFNLAIVWAATGIWHGANWTFIVWGSLYGVIIIGEKLSDWPKKVAHNAVCRFIYQPITLLCVILGWVLFRSTDIAHALKYISSMFGSGETLLVDGRFIFNIESYGLILLIAIVCSTPVFSYFTRRFAPQNVALAKVVVALGYLIQTILFFISISFLAMDAHNPFIYFNF